MKGPRKLTKVLLSSVATLSVFAVTAQPILAAEWHARTVEEVSADINDTFENGNSEYTIRWGDTLSVIANATNIKTEVLQQWNNIYNPDYILTGDNIRFDDETITITDNRGAIILEHTVMPEEKIDANKPAGKPIRTSNESDSNTQANAQGENTAQTNNARQSDVIEESQNNIGDNASEEVVDNEGDTFAFDDSAFVNNDGQLTLDEDSKVKSEDGVEYAFENGTFKDKDGNELTYRDGKFFDKDGNSIVLIEGTFVDQVGNKYEIRKADDERTERPRASIIYKAKRR